MFVARMINSCLQTFFDNIDVVFVYRIESEFGVEGNTQLCVELIG